MSLKKKSYPYGFAVWYFKVVGIACLLAGICPVGAVHAAAAGVAELPDYDRASKELNQAPILVHGVHGQVTVTTRENSPPAALKNGETLKQGCVVTTGPKSTVDLIFSNGTVLALDAGTVLSVDEFMQAGGYSVSAPLHDGKTVIDRKIPTIGTIDKEPSYSRTKIFLRDGTMYAQVKHLDKKSTFLVGNPLGISKILGTTWRQSVTADRKNLKKHNSILLKEGLIEFDPIDSHDKPHKPVFIHPQEEVKVEGTFANVQSMDQVVSVDSVNVNVSVDVNIDVQREPIRDPEFPALVAAFLPPDRDDQITPTGPQTPAVDETAPADLGAFGTGDQGVGTLGTQIGGSGGGGGSGTTTNGGNNPPAS